MQTFLPVPDFAESARILDPARRNKQIVEVKQTLIALCGGSFIRLPSGTEIDVSSGGYPHHPVNDMWRGYEYALAQYGYEFYLEYRRQPRALKFRACARMFEAILEDCTDREIPHPFWIGDETIHSIHRAVLLHKDFEHYSQFGWEEEPMQPDSKGSYDYVWPVAA